MVAVSNLAKNKNKFKKKKDKFAFSLYIVWSLSFFYGIFGAKFTMEKPFFMELLILTIPYGKTFLTFFMIPMIKYENTELKVSIKQK